jgi:hypothetical protein
MFPSASIKNTRNKWERAENERVAGDQSSISAAGGEEDPRNAGFREGRAIARHHLGRIARRIEAQAQEFDAIGQLRIVRCFFLHPSEHGRRQRTPIGIRAVGVDEAQERQPAVDERGEVHGLSRGRQHPSIGRLSQIGERIGAGRGYRVGCSRRRRVVSAFV